MDLRYILFGFASLGLIYFAIYRFVFNRFFNWKMIHSIWFPMAVAVFGIYAVISTLLLYDPTAFTDLAAILTGMIFFPPVILFFIAYFVDRALRKSR